MEEERIKSALELAMERISGLPELTPQEIAAQKEKQCRPIGEAMAGRYLNGVFDEDELTSELDKYGAGQRPVIRRALVSSLCRALQLEGRPDQAGRALQAMSRMAPAKRPVIEKAAREFRSIVSEFEQEKQERSAGFETPAAERLGISGSAVRWNLAANGPWLEELKRIREAYEPRLAAVRAGLLDEIK